MISMYYHYVCSLIGKGEEDIQPCGRDLPAALMGLAPRLFLLLLLLLLMLLLIILLVTIVTITINIIIIISWVSLQGMIMGTANCRRKACTVDLRTAITSTIVP